jgi:DNA (cytosine-5)-methyltransferase 1
MARLGLGSGWRCLFANDFDAVKAATYRANFGGEDFREGDVFDLAADDLPGVADLAWASSPCQDFSLAGRRAGLAGGRLSALLGFWRLIEALNARERAPRMVVIENVAGLLTSHDGRDLEAVCRAFTREGYRFGALEIDAAGFLPQSRRRVSSSAHVRTAEFSTARARRLRQYARRGSDCPQTFADLGCVGPRRRRADAMSISPPCSSRMRRRSGTRRPRPHA